MAKKNDNAGYCCPVLHLAVSRANFNTRTGIMNGMMIEPATGKVRCVPVIYFPKAKRGDESTYGFKSKYGQTNYAPCNWCPFCGAKLRKEQEVEPKESSLHKPRATSRPKAQRNGRVARRRA